LLVEVLEVVLGYILLKGGLILALAYLLSGDSGGGGS